MSKCYHQSIMQYDEFENGETGEIICADFDVCRDCGMIILNGKEMGYGFTKYE